MTSRQVRPAKDLGIAYFKNEIASCLAWVDVGKFNRLIGQWCAVHEPSPFEGLRQYAAGGIAHESILIVAMISDKIERITILEIQNLIPIADRYTNVLILRLDFGPIGLASLCR